MTLHFPLTPPEIYEMYEKEGERMFFMVFIGMGRGITPTTWSSYMRDLSGHQLRAELAFQRTANDEVWVINTDLRQEVLDE